MKVAQIVKGFSPSEKAQYNSTAPFQTKDKIPTKAGLNKAVMHMAKELRARGRSNPLQEAWAKAAYFLYNHVKGGAYFSDQVDAFLYPKAQNEMMERIDSIIAALEAQTRAGFFNQNELIEIKQRYN